MRLKISVIAVSMIVAGAVSTVPAEAGTWSQGSRLCTHTNPEIKETSGLSRSTYRRKVLFLHNDSGDSARFFAVNRNCKTRAVFSVRGVRPRDWEDMAPGPGHTLWFGDIGDNGESRPSINVTRVSEPREIPRNGERRSLAGTTYTLTYPDGAHNAEAMMLRPRSGRIYVITKNRVAGAIYRAPKVLSSRGANMMTKIATVPNGLSGADWARKGGRFVLRGYESVFIYSAMGGEPTRVPVPAGHTFGEAVTWSRNGRALILGGEGVRTSLWRLRES
ncbi:MAG: hypothetical protein ACRCYU_17780 [Nocardioides sp.]